MKIGLFIYGTLDTVSGGYLYDRILVDYLRTRGHTVRLLSLPWRTYADHLGDNFSRTAAQKLLTADVDVLIQDELMYPSFFWLNRRLRARMPYRLVSFIHLIHSDVPQPDAAVQARYRAIERAYLRTVDGFIFNSHTSRRRVGQLLGRNEPPGVVAYPAGDRLTQWVDAAPPVDEHGRDRPLRLLFVGNVVVRKGLHVLLAALAHLPPESWRLDVVGSLTMEPDYAAEMRAHPTVTGRSGHTKFWGVLDGQPLVDRFVTADAMVMPSAYEGFGITYVEAMSFGRAVIGTTAGAAPELITPGENGQLIAPGDAAALAAHLRRWHADRAHLAALGRRAQRTFERLPTWAQSCACIEMYLRQTVSR